MREVTIKLGERIFTVPQLTIKHEARWRQKAEEALAPFMDAMGIMQIDISQTSDLRKVIDQISRIMDPVAAIDAICAYAPMLAAERDWIEENCYSDEVIGALVALFFGQLRQLDQLPQALNGAVGKLSPTT